MQHQHTEASLLIGRVHLETMATQAEIVVGGISTYVLAASVVNQTLVCTGGGKD